MRPKPAKGLFGEINLTSQDSYWNSFYRSADFSLGKSEKQHEYSFGYKSSLDPETNKRDAWYVRYDYNFSKGYSVNFKFIHENWYWLTSAKESMGLAYNVNTDLGLYYSVGYYFRWLKQSWDDDPYIPFTFDTDDKEGFLTLLLGIAFDNGHDYWTLDFNNKEAYSYFSADNWAVDFKYHLKTGSSSYLTFLLGVRFTGIMGLSPYPAATYTGLGLQY